MEISARKKELNVFHIPDIKKIRSLLKGLFN